jgi:hypothetical protein
MLIFPSYLYSIKKIIIMKRIRRRWYKVTYMSKQSDCSLTEVLSLKETTNEQIDHFKGKDARSHIAEVQADGVIASAEIHGAETPGFLFALTDAARETALLLLLVFILLQQCGFDPNMLDITMISIGGAWLFWKVFRASWLAWSRLERLHRVMWQEKQEIEQNREQEREELKALYALKGFQGKLLEDVVDVLMADGDRLLRVMLEEEMGFRLEENEHPLIQGLGAGIGALSASVLMVLAAMFADFAAVVITAGVVIGIAAYVYARLERNNRVSAVVWNLGFALFSSLVSYYSLQGLL